MAAIKSKTNIVFTTPELIRTVDLKKVKKLRMDNALTQKDMASLLGCSSKNYNYIESGTVKFSANRLALIADIFGVSIDDLFSSKPIGVG